MNNDATLVQRVIGFDSHPDTFTAALLRGPTPRLGAQEGSLLKGCVPAEPYPPLQARNKLNRKKLESARVHEIARIFGKPGRPCVSISWLGKLGALFFRFSSFGFRPLRRGFT
jgi:hypothetical protein